MFKYLFIILNSLALFLYSALRDDLDIITGFPNKVRAGETFNAEVTIFKGSLRKFGKLELIFPAGFTVESTDPKAADFNFSGNKATFLWSYLPAEEEFTVSFKVTAANTVSGKRVIKSNFYYVENNLKEVLEIDPVEIKVLNETVPEKDDLPIAAKIAQNVVKDSSQKNTVDSSTLAATPNMENTSTSAIPSNNSTISTTEVEANNSTISAVRSIAVGNSNTEYKITHTIKKAELNGFGKIEDLIPEGYAAASDKTSGASYTFNTNKVRFVWVNMPSDKVLEVSYYIKKNGTTANNRISGTFDYLKNNETQSVNILETLIPTVEEANPSLANNTIEPIVKKEKAKPTEGALTGYRPNAKKLPPKPKKASTLNTQTVDNVVRTEPTIPATDTTVLAKVDSDPQTNKVIGATEKLNSTNTASAIKFSVQVAALQKQKEAAKMQRVLAISNRLQIEYHEGYSKYVTEKFDEYKKAKSTRDQIRDNGKRRAFVTAYNTGKRITVQEALMIANQQWYK